VCEVNKYSGGGSSFPLRQSFYPSPAVVCYHFTGFLLTEQRATGDRLLVSGLRNPTMGKKQTYPRGNPRLLHWLRTPGLNPVNSNFLGCANALPNTASMPDTFRVITTQTKRTLDESHCGPSFVVVVRRSWSSGPRRIGFQMTIARLGC
jgi:hypothetical protein